MCVQICGNRSRGVVRVDNDARREARYGVKAAFMPGRRTRGYVFRKIDRDKIVDEENALYGRGFCPLEAFYFFQLGVGAVEVKARLDRPRGEPSASAALKRAQATAPGKWLDLACAAEAEDRRLESFAFDPVAPASQDTP